MTGVELHRRRCEAAQVEIVDRIETPTLGSYLLQGCRDGRRVGEFWCRVSVFDRHVSVVGDFDPIVFAYGPTGPRELIAWMGSHPTVDSYVAEKAAIGSGGRDKISRWDVEQAREDLLMRVDELRVEAEAASDDETWYADRCAELDRLLEIAYKLPEYDDRLGCDLLAQQVHEALECPCDEGWIEDLGRSLDVDVHLAHAAVARLHALLLAEEASR